MLAGLLLAQAPQIKSMDGQDNNRSWSALYTAGVTTATALVGLATWGIYSFCNKVCLNNAARSGNNNRLERLDERSINQRFFDYTPLHTTVIHNNLAGTIILLAQGANPNLQDTDWLEGNENSPLITATRRVEKDFVAVLVAADADRELRDRSGETAQMCADVLDTNPMAIQFAISNIGSQREFAITAIRKFLAEPLEAKKYALKMLDRPELALSDTIKQKFIMRFGTGKISTACATYEVTGNQQPLLSQLNKNNWAFRHFTAARMVPKEQNIKKQWQQATGQRPALPSDLVQKILSYNDSDQLTPQSKAQLLQSAQQKAQQSGHTEVTRLIAIANHNNNPELEQPVVHDLGVASGLRHRLI